MRFRWTLLSRVACVGLMVVAYPAPDLQTTGVERPGAPALPAAPHATSEAARAGVLVAHSRMPMRFEPSLGRAAADVDFIARGPGYTAYLSGREAQLVLTSGSDAVPSVLRLRLIGARAPASVQGLNVLPGTTNHLIGDNPSRWRMNVPGYARVEYKAVYPGIDVVYHANVQNLEYDFVLAPRARPDSILLEFEGVTDVAIDPDGRLVLGTPYGKIVQPAPVIYQETATGERRTVEGGYALQGDTRVGFQVGRYDADRPLVIDPVLTYSTFLGGTAGDFASATAVDPHGFIYVAGQTQSLDFPVRNAAQSDRRGGLDAFVAKLTPAGDALVFATYLGGRDHDYVRDLAVDAAGSAYVVGNTSSSDFPTVRALQPTMLGIDDAFVAKLDGDGGVSYSTYLGGSQEDGGQGVAVDAWGRAHVTGTTYSPDFPTVNPLQPALGGYPAFVTHDGGRTWSGVQNGLRTSGVLSLAIDPANTATIFAGTAGEGIFRSTDGGRTWTTSTNGQQGGPESVVALAIAPGTPPVIYAADRYGVFRSDDGGSSWTMTDLYAGPITSLAVDPASPMTIYVGTEAYGGADGVYRSTDGGGTWSPTGLAHAVSSLAVSTSPASIVYAGTNEGVFRSHGGDAWTPVGEGLPAGYVYSIAVDPTDASLVYAGTEGGLFKSSTAGAEWHATQLSEFVIGLVVAPSEPSTVYISTVSALLVTHDRANENFEFISPSDVSVSAVAVDPNDAAKVYAGGGLMWDAYITTLSPDGSAVEFSTYLGGAIHEQGNDIAVDQEGGLYVTGYTSSTDFPVRNAVQTRFGGIRDVFAAKVTADRSLAYATYLGGSAWEGGATIAVDGSGQLHVAGYTLSSDFPIQHAHQAARRGRNDAFLTKLTHDGSAFVYSTYLGGAGEESGPFAHTVGRDPVAAIALTTSGDAVVSGTTTSVDFPAVNAVQPAFGGGESDGFVASFSAAGAPHFATYLGGSGSDRATRAAADPVTGDIVVVGATASANFPTRRPFQPALAGADDAFVARLSEVPPDTSPPVVSITSPEARDYLHSDRLTLAFTAADEDSALAAGSPAGSLDDAPVANGQTVDLLSLALGTHTLTVSASDVHGNGTQASVTFRIVATLESLMAAVDEFAARGKMTAKAHKSLMQRLTVAGRGRDLGVALLFRKKVTDFIDEVRERSGTTVAADAEQVLVADGEYVLQNAR